jgi:hypothetical protein
MFITEIEKFHLETQETMNSQGNTQQKEQCWRSQYLTSNYITKQ